LPGSRFEQQTLAISAESERVSRDVERLEAFGEDAGRAGSTDEFGKSAERKGLEFALQGRRQSTPFFS
jgi:hypothetical protein